VARACRYFGISRQAFYQAGHRHQRRDAAVSTALALASDCRARQPRLGMCKLHHLIESKLLAAESLWGALVCLTCFDARLQVPLRRADHKTTKRHHRFRRYPNLLELGD